MQQSESEGYQTTPGVPGRLEDRVRFSVVVPVHNSEPSLQELYDRLAATFAAMECGFEVVFVNDDSRDGSLDVLRSLRQQHPDRVRVLSLVRNQGQHVALMRGFQFCSGDIVVTIDDDLQHSPEDIPAMYAVLQQGHDAVFGSYRQKAHGFIQNLGSAFVRRLNRHIFDLPRGLRLTSFRLIRRDVVDHFKTARTSFPYISGLIFSTTRNVVNVDVRHEPRHHGHSGYSLPKLIRLSFNLLINYSAMPLKAMAWIGMGTSLLAFLAAGTFAARQLMIGRAPEGWTSLAVLISVFFAILFAMMFVMAEYLSRLLTDSADRPAPPIREILE